MGSAESVGRLMTFGKSAFMDWSVGVGTHTGAAAAVRVVVAVSVVEGELTPAIRVGTYCVFRMAG